MVKSKYNDGCKIKILKYMKDNNLTFTEMSKKGYGNRGTFSRWNKKFKVIETQTVSSINVKKYRKEILAKIEADPKIVLAHLANEYKIELNTMYDMVSRYNLAYTRTHKDAPYLYEKNTKLKSAILLALKSGKGVRTVMREFGVARSTLYRWRDKMPKEQKDEFEALVKLLDEKFKKGEIMVKPSLYEIILIWLCSLKNTYLNIIEEK